MAQKSMQVLLVLVTLCWILIGDDNWSGSRAVLGLRVEALCS